MRNALAIFLLLFSALSLSAQSKPQRIKVTCSGGEKSRTLWEGPYSIKVVAEVKCGRKVTILGSVLLRSGYSYFLVATEDDKKGYLPQDALQSEKSGPSVGKAVAEGVAQGLQNYARVADPHTAWCDDHGGFSQRATETENVSVTNSSTGQPIGTGTIAHTYVVCKDGTRIKEM